MARCERQKPRNQGVVVYKRHQYRTDDRTGTVACKACGKVKY